MNKDNRDRRGEVMNERINDVCNSVRDRERDRDGVYVYCVY